MIVAGALGHAKEIAGLFSDLKRTDRLFFFDDVMANPDKFLFNRFPILRSDDEVRRIFKDDPEFVLGIGGPSLRESFAKRFRALGGQLVSVISPAAAIGNLNVTLGEGLNVMHGAVITADVVIGEGTIVHSHASVHHDVRVGTYCELSPGCRILGRCELGDFVSIGAGAVILPRIKIGKGATIGAGAVVTNDVAPGQTVVGVPARAVNK